MVTATSANVVWANTFDGPDGTALTVENSADYGDPVFSLFGGEALYTTARAAAGTASLYLGAQAEMTQVFAELSEAAHEWSMRFYLWVPEGAQGNVQITTGSTTSNFLYFAAGQVPTFLFYNLTLPAGVSEALVGRWVRVEAVCSEQDEATTLRLWWNNPHSVGDPDHEETEEGTNYFDLSVFVLTGAESDTEGSWIDEVAVSNTAEWIGPAELTAEVLWQNDFDGPDGEVVTTDNSANYGDPLAYVGNDAYYDHSWSVSGDGSLRLGPESSTSSVESEVLEIDDWSARVYIYLPSDAVELLVGVRTYSGGPFDELLHIDFFEEVAEVLGQNVDGGLGHLLGSAFRMEASKIADGCTVRLWWTSIHSPTDPDYEVSVADTNWAPFDALTLTAGHVPSGVNFDAAAVGNGPWIGPIEINEAITEVNYSVEAVGVVGGSANAVTAVEFPGQVQGFRSDVGAALGHVSYSAQAEGEGFIPTVAAADVTFGGEVTGGPYYQGDGGTTVEYTADIEASKTTSGDALEKQVAYDATAVGQARTHLPGVPLVGMQYRLIAYDPDGQRRGQLPWPLSFQLGVPLNDASSLALEYLKDAPGADLLNSLCEVAVEFAPAGSPNYTEPPGCRFLNLRHQEDPTDRTGVIRYTMPSYAWMLRKVRNLNTDALNEDGEREFSSATAGQILHAFLSEAQERGNIPGMEWDFTTTHDSYGQPWETVYNIAFDAGQDLWSVLDALSTQHVVDWRVNRRTLQMYVPDTQLSRNRTNNAVLRLNRDVTEAPNDRTAEELASVIYVQGDNAHVQLSNNSGMQPWGAWEDYISQSGVSDTGTLTTLAQWRMETTSGVRTQMTRGIAFNTARHLPFFAYQVGDYISAPGWFSQMDPLRVRQITINSTDPHSLEGNLVLNDRFIERQLRNDRKLNALTGGSPPGGGSGGGRPPGEDTRTPQAPQSLLLHSESYINELGEPRAQITADWEPVTEATNNTEMNISHYEVWLRRAAFGSGFQFQTEVSDTTAFMSPFEAGEVYEVRVRAVGSNDRPGLWSNVESVRGERDTTPPDQPSAPTVTSRLGVIQVLWDGLDYLGQPMPIDFDHLQVWMGTTPTISEFEHVDTLYRAGVSVIPEQPYEEERFFYFIAEDRAGNESEPSAVSSGRTSRLVPIDVTPGSIGYELLEEGAVRDEVLADEAVMNRHVAAGQITGEKVRAYSIFADRLAVGTSRNLLTDPHHRDEDLNQTRLEISPGPWSYEFDAEGDQNQLVFTAQGSDEDYSFYYVQTPEAESYQDREAGLQVSSELGRVITRGQIHVEGLESGQIFIGLAVRFFARDGRQVAWVYSASPITLTEDGDYELISDNGSSIRDDADYAVVAAYVTTDGANAGAQLSISQIFAALSNGQVLIENGAISANKIQANAITSDKIEAGAISAQHIQANAIDTDQLSARAITAKHTITGATIQTTATANRGVKMTSTGLRAYDSNGSETFSVSASSGNVVTTGTYRSGLSGQNRIVISPSANYLNQPGLRMYSGSSGARDSSLFIADAGGTGGWDPYTVVLTGSEVTRNSSGRTDLALNHGNGGGGYLRYQYGSYGAIGVQFESWNMYIRGRITSGQGSHDTIIWAQSGSTASGITNWEFPYGSNAPNGDRLVMATGYGNNSQGREVQVTVTTQNTGNFYAVSNSSGTHRVQYVAFWVDGNI